MNKKQELAALLADVKDARDHSRNMGSLSNYWREDSDGCLVIDFVREGHYFAPWLNPCTVDWGDIIMSEDCLAVKLLPNKEHGRQIAFIFNYFYDKQSLYVFPKRMKEEKLQAIIDWIHDKINH